MTKKTNNDLQITRQNLKIEQHEPYKIIKKQQKGALER